MRDPKTCVDLTLSHSEGMPGLSTYGCGRVLQVVAYERPALSKAYLFPDGTPRLWRQSGGRLRGLPFDM